MGLYPVPFRFIGIVHPLAIMCSSPASKTPSVVFVFLGTALTPNLDVSFLIYKLKV